MSEPLMNPFLPPTKRPIKVMTVDDHPLMRDGIAAVIRRQADMTIVGEAIDGKDAIARYAQWQPDITLMDLQMPNLTGEEAVRAIRKQNPDARIVVLTTYRGDAQATRALQAGAAGYLLKTTLRRELLDAIRAVHRGERWIPIDVAEALATHLDDATLSKREIEVLHFVARGDSNREIGNKLFVSEETIKSRMKTILAKLEARDRTHAISIALERGIIAL